MQNFTIKVTDISGGKGKAFKAVIPELNNSIIMADKLKDIWKLLPNVLEISKKDSIGIFAPQNASSSKKRGRTQSASKHPSKRR